MANGNGNGPRQLNEILEEAFALRFEGDVREALMKRARLRKQLQGQKVDTDKLDPRQKALVLNALNEEMGAEAEAEAALTRAKQREARRQRGENLAFQQEEIGDPVLRRLANPFGVVDAAKNLLIRKDRALFVE